MSSILKEYAWFFLVPFPVCSQKSPIMGPSSACLRWVDVGKRRHDCRTESKESREAWQKWSAIKN